METLILRIFLWEVSPRARKDSYELRFFIVFFCYIKIKKIYLFLVICARWNFFFFILVPKFKIDIWGTPPYRLQESWAIFSGVFYPALGWYVVCCNMDDKTFIRGKWFLTWCAGHLCLLSLVMSSSHMQRKKFLWLSFIFTVL